MVPLGLFFYSANKRRFLVLGGFRSTDSWNLPRGIHSDLYRMCAATLKVHYEEESPLYLSIFTSLNIILRFIDSLRHSGNIILHKNCVIVWRSHPFILFSV